MFWTPEQLFARLDLPANAWQPAVTDHYRFALTNPSIDGLLASPSNPEEVDALADALALGALDEDEEHYLKRLTKLAFEKSGNNPPAFGPAHSTETLLWARRG